MASRSYSSNYSIKDFAINEVAPAFFPEDVVNGYNVGLLGYTTDLFANVTEDMFNTIPILMKEIHPNIAQLPETIYNYASLFQEDNMFATPASMDTFILINVEDILRFASKREHSSEYSDFILDANTCIDVEDQKFLLDYDLRITVKPYKGDYVYTASYIINYNNGLSDISNPYIKLQKVNYNSSKYIGLLIKVRRVDVFENTYTILNNDKINVPTINFTYTDQLTNFEVFYKAPDSDDYIQLTKKLLHSHTIKTPFCYYRMKNENTVEISFTTRENYFKPEFNSEILVRYWTSTGDEGNFDLYKGDDIVVRPTGNKYEYNTSVPLFAIPQTASIGGRSAMTLEELREKVTDNFSTVLSYTTEPDLQRYFNTFKYLYNQDIIFIKKRDDIFERLFSSFSLFRDENSNFYKTNTLNMELKPSDFDLEYEQSGRKILKPGRMFQYRDAEEKSYVVRRNDLDLHVVNYQNDFTFTNPFLMTVSKQGIVGYYMNSLDKKIELDYQYINSNSLVQFICNNIYITRNALSGDDSYEIKLIMTATDKDIDSPLVDENGNDTGRIRVKIMLEDKSGKEICYIDTQLSEFNPNTMMYEFVGKLKTDDYITVSEKIRVNNVKNLYSDGEIVTMVPMKDLTMNIHTFFRYDTHAESHAYTHLDGLNDFTLTNSYTTEKEKVNLVFPISMMKSNMQYKKNGDSYNLHIKSVPLIRALDVLDSYRFMQLLDLLDKQFDYMSDILDKKTNNYSVDMKFFNSYGRSKNFGVDDELNDLDVINCGIHFKLATHYTPNVTELVTEMKMFIKDYFEDINNNALSGIYISNLIQALENQFSEIKYLKFVKLNNYDASIQNIENKHPNLESLDKLERLEYVPEFLNIDIDDIIIELIN